MRPDRPIRLSSVGLISLALAIVGCGSSDDGGDGGASFTGAPVTTYVSFVRDNGIASTARGDASFASDFQVIAEAEGGMALDYLGNLYQADLRGDDGGAILILSRVAGRTFDDQGGVPRGATDREIFGFSTGLDEPRSVALAHAAGLVFVTDTGDSTIKAFGTAAGGDAPPIFVAAAPAAPWDLVYVEADDILYATLSDGRVAVYPDFVATEPFLPSSTFAISVDGTTQASIDLRGISVVPDGAARRLIVSDFGMPDAGGDGAIYVVDDIVGAIGLITPDQTLRGATSGLRDPIDLAVAPDGTLRVIDAGTNRALVFQSRAVGRYNAAPTFSRTFQNPTAVLLEPTSPTPDLGSASDLDSPAVPVEELILATAPAGLNGEVLRAPADLSTAATVAFDSGRPIGGVGVDRLGEVYTTFSDGMAGGLRVMGRLGVARGVGMDVAFDTMRDRLLEIPDSPFGFPVEKPVTPTAFDIDDRADIVILSDPMRPAIWLFGLQAGPDAAELRSLNGSLAVGSAEPGLLDYDFLSDTLYVAISNGTIYVYENFRSLDREAPTSIITPSDALGASQISTNLVGLVHDAERNMLIVSDRGPATGSGADGAIYVFDAASSASGLTAPIATIAGAATTLDEPTGLAWDGSTLWVADNAVGEVLRFDDFMTLDGNVAPTASLAVPDVIAVTLRADGLASATGGSILVQ